MAVSSGKLLNPALEAQGGACAYPSHKSFILGVGGARGREHMPKGHNYGINWVVLRV